MQKERMKRMTKRERVKDLPNKAEGIYYYVSPQHMTFRLINSGNDLASEINHAVSFFTTFAEKGYMDDTFSRAVIDNIYRMVGRMMCDIDIIHAAGGAEVMPEPYESIDFCYGNEYRTLLHEAVINGLPDNYKGPQQNPNVINLVKPSVSFKDPMEKFDFDPDEYNDGEFMSFTEHEEPRDRKIVFHCTKSDLDAIKRFANIIQIKFTEEEIHHA